MAGDLPIRGGLLKLSPGNYITPGGAYTFRKARMLHGPDYWVITDTAKGVTYRQQNFNAGRARVAELVAADAGERGTRDGRRTERPRVG